MKRFLISMAALVCGLLAWRGLHRPASGDALLFARFPAAAVQPAEDLSTCITAIAAQSDSAKAGYHLPAVFQVLVI